MRLRQNWGHVQPIQKTLEDANIKLDSVVTDILGLSGRRIIEVLIAGPTMPQALASLAHRRIHASTDELEASLRGRVTAHHRFRLKLHLDQIDAFDAAIASINKGVDGHVELFRAAIELLSPIPGISALSTGVIVSEIGIDMSRFPSTGDLISWAGLYARNDESAGKRRSNRMKKGAMAKNHSHRMHLARRAHQAKLSPGPIPSHPFQAWRQQSHRRCCRLHPGRR
jgi:hypothetical protein